MQPCFRSLAAVVALAALSSACTSIPQKEFKAYREAFDQSRTVAQEVLLDYSAAAEENAKRKADIEAQKRKDARPRVVPQFPTQFEAIVEKRPGSIKERLRALDTIAHYNDILASLAEGKSVEQVQGSVSALVTTLQSVTTILPGVGELLARVAAEIEKARSREEFKKAIYAGEEPIKKVLGFLKDEASLYYELRLTLVQSDISLSRSRIAQRIDAVEKLVKRSGPITPPPWMDAADQINEEVERIGGLRGRKGPVVLVAGCKPSQEKPACVEVGAEQLTEPLLALKKDVELHQQLVDKINTYHGLLQRYEHLLETTRLAMTTLRVAVDTPQDVTAQIEDLLTTALAIRKDFLKLRNQI